MSIAKNYDYKQMANATKNTDFWREIRRIHKES